MNPSELKKLVAAIKKKFPGEVRVEKVNSKGRVRLEVISQKFTRMSQLKRQDTVWELVDQVLSREAILDVSLILTHSPAELAGAR
jgi:acid stress-induced BolA-like protein IbaG/YrbA